MKLDNMRRKTTMLFNLQDILAFCKNVYFIAEPRYSESCLVCELLGPFRKDVRAHGGRGKGYLNTYNFRKRGERGL